MVYTIHDQRLGDIIKLHSMDLQHMILEPLLHSGVRKVENLREELSANQSMHY